MLGEATPPRHAAGGAAGASPAPPPSDDSEDDGPPAPSPEKVSKTRARQQAAAVSGFSPSRAATPGLRAPPPLPKGRGGRRSRTPVKPKRPQSAAAPPAAAAAPPPPPPPVPTPGELPTPSARIVPDAGELLLKKAALKRRQTVNRLAGQSVTAAKAELAKESSKSSDTDGGPGIRHRARRRMSVLLQESSVHQESMNAYKDWPFMTGEDPQVPSSLALR